MTLLVLAAVLAASVYVLRRPMLMGLAGMLVTASPLERADAAVVLGGEGCYTGCRVRAAVELYKAGWVGKLVLSGPRLGYGVYETEFSLPLAVSLGVPSTARSTAEEAQLLCPLLERRGIRSFYVVSSNFHTRRARRIFLNAGGGRLRVLAYPAPDDWFLVDGWWRSREGRKIFVTETAKAAYSLIE
jgi:uncharacterized SAM-binding protein YcdF (DUF218 family)